MIQEQLTSVRSLISKDDIPTAINRLLEIADGKHREHLIVLSRQFEDWEDAFMLGQNPLGTTRNRITYALLRICSQIELSKESPNPRLTKEKLNIESNLEFAYGKLTELSEATDNHAIIPFLLKVNAERFEKLILNLVNNHDPLGRHNDAKSEIRKW